MTNLRGLHRPETEMAISNSQKCGLSSKANPELLKYAAMYVVLAAIVMGKGKVASCQPDADSPVKAICPISNPVRGVKEAGVRAVVSSALVKSDSSNSAAHTGPELHSDGECRIVVPGRAWAGRSSPNRISRRRRRHRGWVRSLIVAGIGLSASRYCDDIRYAGGSVGGHIYRQCDVR